MKLYTINATPVRSNNSELINNDICSDYPQLVSKLLAKYGIDGFTIYEVKGYWQGEAERSFKIEIAFDVKDDADTYIIMLNICEALRDTWNQDCVMLTNPDNTVEFI